MTDQPLIFTSESSFSDLRGTYFPLFSSAHTQKASVPPSLSFVQDSICINNSKVFRGFHGDNHTHKLISPIRGDFILYFFNYEKYLVSSSLKVTSLLVSGDSNISILLPPNFANAYLSLSQDSIYYYKQTTEYGQYPQYTVSISDPKLVLDLPYNRDDLVLSKRDSS